MSVSMITRTLEIKAWQFDIWRRRVGVSWTPVHNRTFKVLRSGYFCFCRLPVNKIYPDTGISISANLYIHSALIVCNEKKYSLNKWLLVSLFDSFVQTSSCVFYSSNPLYWLSILLLSLLSLHKISSAQQTYFLVYSLFGMWLLITART